MEQEFWSRGYKTALATSAEARHNPFCPVSLWLKETRIGIIPEVIR